MSSPRAAQARSRLQPVDISLKHHRAYQWTRRAVLSLSVATTFGLPLWHLKALGQQSGGLAGFGATAAATGSVGLTASTPPLLGMPGAFSFFGLEFVDPLALAGVLLTRGPSWLLLWSAAPALLLVLLLGRFFCGWLCPYLPILAASNAARWLLARAGLRPPDAKVPRVTARLVLVAVLFVSAVLGVQVLPLVYPPSILGREAFRLVFFGSLSLGAVVVGGAFLFDTFVSRAGFCRSLCPGGAMFSLLGAPSVVRVVRHPPDCTDCTVCDVVCNLGQQPMTDQLDSGCERCGKCIAACPTDALKFALRVPGRKS
ncbi:MAG: putative ferredoxin-type protein [Myxococcaceae bacterium]|nr:putative ferredoxin-type protein [Myxococcaceae bacterium]